MISQKSLIMSFVFSVASLMNAEHPNHQFLMTANRAELVQAYLAQHEDKDRIRENLRQVMQRNYKLEHDHFSLKAEYFFKGVGTGVVLAIAGVAITYIVTR